MGDWTTWRDPHPTAIHIHIRIHIHMTDADNTWDARIRASLDRVVDEGRWRAPREFDALGPAGLLEGGRPSRWSRSRPTTISD